jgi:hypothetical protein
VGVLIFYGFKFTSEIPLWMFNNCSVTRVKRSAFGSNFNPNVRDFNDFCWKQIAGTSPWNSPFFCDDKSLTGLLDYIVTTVLFTSTHLKSMPK